jgi:7-cyano-7-deazaguanine reductase
MSDSSLVHTALGRDVAYPTAYDPGLLFPVARTLNRASLAVPASWHGADIWNAYEISWLNPRGKPVVALGRFVFPYDSPNLVESKSFKLYLNSFSEGRYENEQRVMALMAADLSKAAGAHVDVSLQLLGPQDVLECRPLEGDSIDALDVAIDTYEPAPHLLRCLESQEIVTETLTSDLLKSNCPVTGQPDWGSVQIRYTGRPIDRAALLQYIVSLRRHTEFHEHCVEHMYCDIWKACQPQALQVYARYTRRGGLDINPWRASAPGQVSEVRGLRQ